MLDSGEGLPKRMDYSHNRIVAENSALVKNQLLNPVFATYYMGWKHQVNPQSKDMSVLYHGMGPDASTVLLSTDATEVTSIDPKHPSVQELKHCLAHWDTIDTDLFNLPGKLHVMDPSVADHPTEENLNSYLRGILTNKRESGHWDSLDISALGVSRSLLIELKRMGIDKDSIRIDGEGGMTTMSFDWAYPGEKPKKRRLNFGDDYIDTFLNTEIVSAKKYDCFYEKSIMAGPLLDDKKTLTKLLGRLTDGAFLLLGPNNATDANTTTGIGIAPISLAPEYSAAVLAAKPDLQNGYTWQLNGYKKSII